MGNLIMYALFLCVFFLDFFHVKLGIIPRYATWILDLLAVLVGAMVAVRLACSAKLPFDRKYLFLMILFSISIAGGIALNQPSALSIVAGVRFYFKSMPFFLLPAVFNTTEDELEKQLKFVFPMLLMQCPIALLQKFIYAKRLYKGDVVSGFFETSSILSIVMICSLAVLFAFYLKERVSTRFFLITAAMLFVPTTINSTKGTLVLLPFAIGVPALLINGSRIMKTRILIKMGAICTILLIGFIAIEDHFMRNKTGYSVVEFFTNKNLLARYLYSSNTDKHLYRGDAIELAYDNLTRDTGTLLFGVGMGNATDSFFETATGSYSDSRKFASRHMALTNIAWEMGVFGVIFFVLFFMFVFKDALSARRLGGLSEAFAVGWGGVVIVMGLSLAYKNFLQANVLSFLFWYFSGVVAINAFRVKAISSSVMRLRVPLRHLHLCSERLQVARTENRPCPD